MNIHIGMHEHTRAALQQYCDVLLCKLLSSQSLVDEIDSEDFAFLTPASILSSGTVVFDYFDAVEVLDRRVKEKCLVEDLQPGQEKGENWPF